MDTAKMFTLAIAIAVDTAKPECTDVEIMLEQGGYFFGIRLIYKPNCRARAYATIEPFDDIDAKATEIEACPFIENVDSRSH